MGKLTVTAGCSFSVDSVSIDLQKENIKDSNHSTISGSDYEIFEGERIKRAIKSKVWEKNQYKQTEQK